MTVEVLTQGRRLDAGGLEVAEAALLRALQDASDPSQLRIAVRGGRSARAYAHHIGGQWQLSARGFAVPRLRSPSIRHYTGLGIRPNLALPYLITVHDLAALQYDDEAPPPPWLAKGLANAERVVTPSQFTKREVASSFPVDPERILVIPNGPGLALDTKARPLGQAELRQLGIAAPFFLRIGGYTQRKNVAWLLRAWSTVRTRLPNLQLVLVGPEHPQRLVLLNGNPSKGVRLLGQVPAELLARLMLSSAAVVSPSLHEGFGLPMLEGMLYGKPVIALDTPFAREVCDDAAIYVRNEVDLVEAAENLLTSEDLRSGLGQRGIVRATEFTWGRAAQKLLQAYEAVGREALSR